LLAALSPNIWGRRSLSARRSERRHDFLGEPQRIEAERVRLFDDRLGLGEDARQMLVRASSFVGWGRILFPVREIDVAGIHRVSFVTPNRRCPLVCANFALFATAAGRVGTFGGALFAKFPEHFFGGFMEYVTFGRTGLRVSVAGLGCGGFSRLGLGRGKSEAEAVTLIHLALDLGVNLFDTAAAYGTEAVLARRSRRSRARRS
jgi:hypothetical protein